MTSEQSPVYYDCDLGRRYEQVALVGRKQFHDTALTTPDADITLDDIAHIDSFLEAVSPSNPSGSWRIDREANRSGKWPSTRQNDPRTYVPLPDGSTYKNWSETGGPLEHIHLATAATSHISDFLQKHMLDLEQIPLKYHPLAEQIRNVNTMKLRAAGKLHDVGRLLTHQFFTNELIGRALLKKIGVRNDILEILPSEDVMLAFEDISNPTLHKLYEAEKSRIEKQGETKADGNPLSKTEIIERLLKKHKRSDKTMRQMIFSLTAEQVILRLADEFGKRYPGRNQLYVKNDYENWERQKWADGYLANTSPRASQRFFKEHAQLHVENVPAYFEELEKWVNLLTSKTLKDLTDYLGEKLNPTLPLLPQPNQ